MRDESLRCCSVRRRLAVLSAACAVAVSGVVAVSSPVAEAAPAGDNEVIAVVARGVGNGHGRGLSQWGSYGRAVAGQSWQQILDTYYGGTTLGVVAPSVMTVDLTAWRDAITVGVTAGTGATVHWNGGNYASLFASEVPGNPNMFNVQGSQQSGCPGSAISWTLLTSQPVAGPITFTTNVDQSAASPGQVLGLCRPSGLISRYRGEIRVQNVSSSGANRVVNALNTENYLRGVIPREVPASWGDAAGGAGMNALRAQAVAARSYALSQNRYPSYNAKTCDTSSCQVYGGAEGEHANADRAIGDTAHHVRYRGGAVVSTEFSASNGPRTAGGSFPPVDDPFDDTPGNPLHSWTRVIDADRLNQTYGLSTANGVHTRRESGSQFDGIWANEVVLAGSRRVSAWDFRNAFGLPSPGFELIPIRRTITSPHRMAFIGDSVGVSVTGSDTTDLKALLDGVYSSAFYDSLGARSTQQGAAIAATVPVGTELAVVELGYNDTPSTMPGRIDAVMRALRDRGVGTVVWVNVSERRTSTNYAATNAAIKAATGRWTGMIALDWNGHSSHASADRWFADNVHLTATGRAEFSLWLRDQIVWLTAGGYVPPRPLRPGIPLRVPVVGTAGMPNPTTEGGGVAGVALNITAVLPAAAGWFRVWPCGSPEPDTSTVNFASAGVVEPNAAIVPIDATGEVCVRTTQSADVIVDTSGWFTGGLRTGTGRIVDTRLSSRVQPATPLRVKVTGAFGVPEAGAAGVALNVTAVNPVRPGWLRVWPCGLPEPDTSSVNYSFAGAVEPNAVVVPVDATGEVCVRTLEEADVIVDLTGWFDSGLKAGSGRLVDTRLTSRVQPSGPLRVKVAGVFGVPEAGAAGVALNVTAVNPVRPGWLRVWPCGSPEPETSSVNYSFAGAVEPNAVVMPVDATGEVCVRTLEQTDVVVDLAGWFDAHVSGGFGARIVDTRIGVGPIPPQ